jgi:penicillin-binding protein 2
MVWKRHRKHKRPVELHPDEILLDARNLPEFNTQQFEGRMERPIAKRSLTLLFFFMTIVVFFFVGRLGILQISQAQYYTKKSEQNSLDHIPVFAERGIIYDRNGVELAWNKVGDDGVRSVRDYIKESGFVNLLGYVSYPTKDDRGKYWQTTTVGKDGIEKEFDTSLAGKNGTKLIETDVSGQVLSESTIEDPAEGENLSLSIDAEVQSTLASGIASLMESSGYVGGAGAVMDIQTGELIAMVSLPEYDQHVLSLGKDNAKIREYLQSPSRPFLNRMTEGLYTPGSIVKPFMALAALQEGIIDPAKVFHTTGELRIPNPYNPGQYTIFRDNADHGDVDMRKGIAVSSNVYFFILGGGFGSQEGLGIARIEKYARLFGIGEKTGINFAGELGGIIPSVAWKAKVFPNDPWRIGDTYNTSIGQYGFQVTPIQMLRAVSGIASKGTLVTPTVLKNTDGSVSKMVKLPFNDSEYSIIHSAMRAVVTEGTAQILNNDTIHVAAKTGTAQIKGNTRVNSWSLGFFPLEAPRYAYVVLMENGPKVSSGASHAFRPVLDLYLSRALPNQ